MKIRLKKWNGGLIPFDDEAREVLAKKKHGEMVEADIVTPRNYEFHKKFFLMLNLVYDNTDEFKSLDNLLSYIKIMTGECDIIEANGIAFRVPRSISFAKMDNEAFDRFYSSAVDECLKLVPLEKETLAQQIAQF